MGETSGSTETAQSKTAWLSWIYPEVFKSHEGRWEIIPTSFLLFAPPPPLSFLLTVAHPLVQIFFSPQPSTPSKIKYGRYNFHQENTRHSFLKKFAHANRLTLMQEMGLAVYPSVATRQFNHLFCKDKRNWVACNLHREYFLKQLSVAILTFKSLVAEVILILELHENQVLQVSTCLWWGRLMWAANCGKL